MQRATLADWTHLIPSDIQARLFHLATAVNTHAFMTAEELLLRMRFWELKMFFQLKAKSPELYDKISKKKGYNYYKCKYTLPYAMAVDKSILDIKVENANWMELNNQLYKSLTSTDENIVENGNLALKSKTDETEIYTFKSEKGNISYFKLDGAGGVRITLTVRL